MIAQSVPACVQSTFLTYAMGRYQNDTRSFEPGPRHVPSQRGLVLIVARSRDRRAIEAG